MDSRGIRASSWWNAQSLAVLLGFELAQLALVIDVAGVAAGRVGAGKHVHQGGFARPVLADQGVDFPGLYP